MNKLFLSRELIDFFEQLVEWYNVKKRDLPWRHSCTPYGALVSEVMLQQTRVDTVISYYIHFLEVLPDIESLANAPEELLMQLWQGLGYYRRVRNLQKAAQQILLDYDGKFPETYEAIKSLSGIGEYTAGAISSIAFNLPYPAIDGNVVRVLSRLYARDLDIKTIREMLLPIYQNFPDRSALTQSFMDLGATICLPNGKPNCLSCPWKEFCIAHRDHNELKFPAAKRKLVRKKVKMTVVVLKNGDKYAFLKRNNRGVLAGMWELPNFPDHLSGAKINSFFPCGKIIKKTNIKHVFSHLEWYMRVYYLELPDKPEQYCWKLLENCPLPTAFKKLF